MYNLLFIEAICEQNKNVQKYLVDILGRKILWIICYLKLFLSIIDYYPCPTLHSHQTTSHKLKTPTSSYLQRFLKVLWIPGGKHWLSLKRLLILSGRTFTLAVPLSSVLFYLLRCKEDIFAIFCEVTSIRPCILAFPRALCLCSFSVVSINYLFIEPSLSFPLKEYKHKPRNKHLEEYLT